MASGHNIPWFYMYFGPQCAYGYLHTYIAKSDQLPKKVYSDVDLSHPRTNPIQLDGYGAAPECFFEDGGYYFTVTDAEGNEIASRDNVFPSGGGSGTSQWEPIYTWFICLDGYAKPPDMVSPILTDTDKESMVKYTYPIAAQLNQTNYDTGTSLWYLDSYVPGDSTKDVWREVNVQGSLAIINVDRGLRRSLLPHYDLPVDVHDQPTFTQIPSGLYTLMMYGDNYWWTPQVVKEFPEPDAAVTSALVHDATDDQYKWESIDELGGKVKVDAADATAGYLAAKLIADTDPKGKQTIVFTKHGSDGTNKTYGAMVDVDNVYDEIIDKMNPPAYDLFGAYPDEVGVCQLTGIGAALRSKSLKDSAGNDIAWTAGIGQNGAIYGRSCVPGYAWVLNATGTKIHKRIWCAFGSLGQIESSFDRYQSVTHDTSLETVDAGNHYFQLGNSGLSCAAYIKNGTSYYWFVGGFVDNKVYALEDIAANYNDDGTFKSTAWAWIDCAGLPTNTAHICSVESGGFLFTGYHLGGINYKASIAATSSRAINNLPRTNADYVTTITANGYSYGYPIQLPTGLYYGGVTGSAKDSSGDLGATYTQSGQTNVTVNVVFDTLLAEGDVVTITIHSYLYDQNYSGAGFSGVGSDHYGTYSAVDRDTGRIYSNISEVTGTFDPTAWTSTLIYVRNSDADAYSATKVDRLGSTYGSQLPNDPYTWWSSIQSAYGLWVATVALKQATSDPIYAYSDDGIHWTKYTNGVGVGTSGVLAIWDSQSDGMNWYVTNMYDATPLISEMLVNSIPSHKRLVCEKGLGVSGDAFLVDLPNVSVLSTDENGKVIAGDAATIGKDIKLGDLQDVGVDDRVDGQVLTWNTAENRWRSVTPSHGGVESISTFDKALIQTPIVLSVNQWSLYWTGLDLDSSMILSSASKFTAILDQVGSSSETFTFQIGKWDETTSSYVVLAYSNNVSITSVGFITGLCDSLTSSITLDAGRYYLGFITNSTGASLAGFTTSALFNYISPYLLSFKKDNLTSSTVPASFTSVNETLMRFYIKLDNLSQVTPEEDEVSKSKTITLQTPATEDMASILYTVTAATLNTCHVTVLGGTSCTVQLFMGTSLGDDSTATACCAATSVLTSAGTTGVALTVTAVPIGYHVWARIAAVIGSVNTLSLSITYAGGD